MENNSYSSPIAKALLITIAIIMCSAIVSVLGVFWIFPALGIAIAISAGAWGMLITTVFLLCTALLLFLILPFFLVLLLSILAIIWVLAVIILFPIIFPIIFPLFIIVLFIGYLRKRKQNIM